MPHPFYNFFVGLAGSGLAQGSPGAKESALAPELGGRRAEPGRGITSVDHAAAGVVVVYKQPHTRRSLPRTTGPFTRGKRLSSPGKNVIKCK